MYNLKPYKAKSKEEVLGFMEKYPFASITVCSPDGEYHSTQVPFLLNSSEGDLYLEGHVMKATDHYKAFTQNPNIFVLFTGPNCYVSASWYANPQSGSTWNYMSVHIKGTLEFMNEEELSQFMEKLTLKYESYNSSSPTYIKNLPENYVKRLMPMIAGIKVKVDHIDHTFKLSQDKDQASFNTVIEQLKQRDSNAKQVAAEMEKLKRT